MNANEECAALAEHLHAEHRELHQRFRQLQAEFNAIAVPRIDANMRLQMIDLGRQLRQELSHHFAQEEAGGCLEYACSRVAELTREASALEREHPRLLKELDGLLSSLERAGPNELAVAAMKERFDNFVVKLLSHEARENRLVQRGFNMAIDEA